MSNYRARIDASTVLAVADALDRIDESVLSRRVYDGSPNPLLATAALHQAARLMRGALLLAQQEDAAGVGVLARSAFEYWLFGSWALLGGDDAVLGIEIDRLTEQLKLARRVTEEVDDRRVERLKRTLERYEAEAALLPAGRASSMVVVEVAKRLGRYITDRFPEENNPDVERLYDWVYRSHSTFDTHPSFTLNRLISPGDRVDFRQQTSIEPAGVLRTLTAHLVLLAFWIDETRGQDSTVWDSLMGRLGGLRLAETDPTGDVAPLP